MSISESFFEEGPACARTSGVFPTPHIRTIDVQALDRTFFRRILDADRGRLRNVEKASARIDEVVCGKSNRPRSGGGKILPPLLGRSDLPDASGVAQRPRT